MTAGAGESRHDGRQAGGDFSTVTLDIGKVRAAAARISPHLHLTPCTHSPWLSHEAGAPVFVKWESLQITGSFKLRGALNKLMLLHERGVSEVLAVSAGNHGLGVAHAARLLGMHATVVVPLGAAPTKVDALRRYGVELVAAGASYDEAEAIARRLSEERAVSFVSPYNDLEVIAGQATAVYEMMVQARFSTLVVPVGGGGLIAGAGAVVRAFGGRRRVLGVQPANAPAMHAALARGYIGPVAEQPTLADGLAGNLEAGSITLPMVRALVDEVLLVGEPAIERAIAGFLEHEHMVVEGSAAVGAAAILEGKLRPEARSSDPRSDEKNIPSAIGVLVTGRNLGLPRIRAILEKNA